jgi:peptidoglycan/xylan/chitin deacetylase (PgdA/CDA1 family)
MTLGVAIVAIGCLGFAGLAATGHSNGAAGTDQPATTAPGSTASQAGTEPGSNEPGAASAAATAGDAGAANGEAAGATDSASPSGPHADPAAAPALPDEAGAGAEAGPGATEAATGTGEAPAAPDGAADGAGDGAAAEATTGEAPAAETVDCAAVACVALTFDDGPDKNTDAVLDVLADRGVKATFFVQGYRVGPYASAVQRAVDEGHVIGNHTYNHADLTTLTAKQITAQLTKTRQAVKDATGYDVTLVRPPYGAIDAKVERYAGGPLILWSVDTRDWESKNVKKILGTLKKEVRPGAIVLMHDTIAQSAKALGRAIDWLRDQGYTLVTVPQLLGDGLKDGHAYSQAG